MKVLEKDLIKLKKLEAYAHAERNIMSQMSHPFIVPLQYAF
jgi:hypothetical protein